MALANWIDATPLIQDEPPLTMVRAAIQAVLPVDRQRHIPTVAVALELMEDIALFRKAPVMVVAAPAAKDPLEFTIAEFDSIKHLLNPTVRIRVLA